MVTEIYDVVVIGGGPVGENIADRVVQGGLSAAVVEHELVGGECSYWACMPTKALLRSAAALRAARRLPGAREAVTGELDPAAVLRRRDEFASHWRDDGQVAWLRRAGIALHRGRGRLRGPRDVDVVGRDGTTVRLSARHAVVVATGSSAVIPDLHRAVRRGALDEPRGRRRRAGAPAPGRHRGRGGGDSRSSTARSTTSAAPTIAPCPRACRSRSAWVAT